MGLPAAVSPTHINPPLDAHPSPALVLYLQAQGGLGGHRSAQHVASGQVAQAVLVLEAGGLCALAASRRACVSWQSENASYSPARPADLPYNLM